jgi:ribosomal protein S18 acetylase RimI-like enzyme
MDTIEIRKATYGEAEGILNCLRAAFEPYRSCYTTEAFQDTVLTPATIHDRLFAMSVYVAVSQSAQIVATVGFSVSNETEGHLRGMAVLPGYQNQGIAGRLLAAVESDLASIGCSQVTLDTTDPLQVAIRFYEAHGYYRSGKVGDFFGMPLHEYVKPLNPIQSRAVEF